MKKAFGVVDLLLAVLIIAVVFALMNGKNPIVEEHARLDVQRQQINQKIDEVQKLKEESLRANQEMFNNINNFDE